MAKQKIPVTPATRFLKQHNIAFTAHLYAYEDKGGTAVSARELGVPEHSVIKTLIMEDENRTPLIILMHGDREVSTKQLARLAGCKTVSPCPPERADKNSGYQVGGTSPFATRRSMPVYMEQSILALTTIYLNGGKRGFLIGLAPQRVAELLQPTLVNVAI
ncbi:MAG TPA: Cys-tRNA(Pro) deacylase [Geothermobacteraceae bacterium]|nr:Cys-tRNA(Pro) deacylase [Geothermobacteraceae bacterium]